MLLLNEIGIYINLPYSPVLPPFAGTIIFVIGLLLIWSVNKYYKHGTCLFQSVIKICLQLIALSICLFGWLEIISLDALYFNFTKYPFVLLAYLVDLLFGIYIIFFEYFILLIIFAILSTMGIIGIYISLILFLLSLLLLIYQNTSCCVLKKESRITGIVYRDRPYEASLFLLFILMLSISNMRASMWVLFNTLLFLIINKFIITYINYGNKKDDISGIVLRKNLILKTAKLVAGCGLAASLIIPHYQKYKVTNIPILMDPQNILRHIRSFQERYHGYFNHYYNGEDRLFKINVYEFRESYHSYTWYINENLILPEGKNIVTFNQLSLLLSRRGLKLPFGNNDSFLSYIAADIDSDQCVDLWSINEKGEMYHIIDDVETSCRIE